MDPEASTSTGNCRCQHQGIARQNLINGPDEEVGKQK